MVNRPKKFFFIWITIVLTVSFIFQSVTFGTKLYYDLSHILTQYSIAFSEQKPSFSLTSEILDRNGNKLVAFPSSENRFFKRLQDISPNLVHAFVSAEDREFYSHHGIQVRAMLRAFFVNLRAQKLQQGASTITQQLVRGYFLNQKKTLERKIKECILAWMLESKISKDEILELYLNKIYLGNHSYGVEAASRQYFGKSAKDVSIGEAAFLAGLAKAPSMLSLKKYEKFALNRQAFVLEEMYTNNWLSFEELESWKKIKPVFTKNSPSPPKNWVLLAEVKKIIARKFPDYQQQLQEGIKIYTSLDSTLQDNLENILNKRSYTLKRISSRTKDLTESASVILSPKDLEILAFTGGLQNPRNEFNRASLTLRPLGDLEQLFTYALAFEKGFDFFSPSPVFRNTSQPHLLFEGMTGFNPKISQTLAYAFGEGTLANWYPKFGMTHQDEKSDLWLASPLEVSLALSSFYNGGYYAAPNLIREIRSYSGKTLYLAPKLKKKKIISKETSFFTTYMLSQIAASQKISIDHRRQNGWLIKHSNGYLLTLWLGSEFGKASLGKQRTTIVDLLSSIGNEWESTLTKSLATASHPPPKISFKLLERKKNLTQRKVLPFIPRL